MGGGGGGWSKGILGFRFGPNLRFDIEDLDQAEQFVYYILFKILLFSLGLNVSLQSKSWSRVEHYIQCVTHHGHPPPTHQTLFQGSRPIRRLISGIWTSQRSNNKMARFV